MPSPHLQCVRVRIQVPDIYSQQISSYSMMLLTVVTMLYVRSLDLFILCNIVPSDQQLSNSPTSWPQSPHQSYFLSRRYSKPCHLLSLAPSVGYISPCPWAAHWPGLSPASTTPNRHKLCKSGSAVPMPPSVTCSFVASAQEPHDWVCSWVCMFFWSEVPALIIFSEESLTQIDGTIIMAIDLSQVYLQNMGAGSGQFAQPLRVCLRQATADHMPCSPPATAVMHVSKFILVFYFLKLFLVETSNVHRRKENSIMTPLPCIQHQQLSALS